MALALSQVAPRLRLFGAAARRPQMQQTLLGAVDELKTACVTPDALEATAARCPGYLGDKLRDLALVLAAYDAVTAQGHADPTDRLTRLAERIPASTLGRTGHFYLDGFTDYTRQELAVVRALLTAGADVTVCLTLDQLSGGSEIFGAARRTARVLLDMADDCGVQATVESCPARAADTPLRVLEQQLFSYTSAHFDDPRADDHRPHGGRSRGRVRMGGRPRAADRAVGCRCATLPSPCAAFPTTRPRSSACAPTTACRSILPAALT